MQAVESTRRRRAWVLSLALLAGCGRDPRWIDCEPIDPSFAELSGRVQLEYDGWAGRAPHDGLNQIHLGMRTENAETTVLEGCGYEGDAFWMASLAFGVPVTTRTPAAIDPSDGDSARASAFLYSCPTSDCTAVERRTNLSARSGQVEVFEPAEGILRAEATMNDAHPASLERGTLHAVVDVTWPTRYQPVLKSSLDGMWHLVTTERYLDSTEDIELWLKLAQDGPRVDASACDGGGNCDPIEFDGVFADPVLTATFTLPGDPAVECDKLQLTLAESQDDFSGELHCPGRGYWFVTMHREVD